MKNEGSTIIRWGGRKGEEASLHIRRPTKCTELAPLPWCRHCNPCVGSLWNYHKSPPSSAPIKYNTSVAANSDTTVVSNTQQSQLQTVDSEGDGLSTLQVKLSWSSQTENGLNWLIDIECGRNGYGDPGSSRNSLGPSNLKYEPILLEGLNGWLVKQLNVVNSPQQLWLVSYTLQRYIRPERSCHIVRVD